MHLFCVSLSIGHITDSFSTVITLIKSSASVKIRLFVCLLIALGWCLSIYASCASGPLEFACSYYRLITEIHLVSHLILTWLEALLNCDKFLNYKKLIQQSNNTLNQIKCQIDSKKVISYPET